MRNTATRILAGLTLTIAFLAVTGLAQPRVVGKETIKGTSEVTTEKKQGTVLQVEGNTVVIEMSTGEIRTVEVDPNRTILIDGKETTVRGLKEGTTLTGTYTTTTTPATDRITSVGEGTVWFAKGINVILTLPNGKNQAYKIKDSDPVQFRVNGQPASVFDLRKGMKVSAVKIVEEPHTIITTDSVVTGKAPVAKQVAQAPVRRTPAPAASPAPARRPAPSPAPAVTQQPAQLPETASPVALVGLLGLLSLGASFGARKLRRS